MHSDPGSVTQRRRIGSASRLAGFLALLLSAVLAVSAFETVHWFDNQSLAATNRNLAAELESFQHTLADRGGSGIATSTVAYLQGRVLPRGEVIMVGLNDGGRFGSAGSAPLLALGFDATSAGTPSDQDPVGAGRSRPGRTPSSSRPR